MNYIWSALIMLSIGAGAVEGQLGAVLNAGLEGAANAFYSVLGFAGLLCFWSGILALFEKGGLAGFLSRVLSPLLSRIFGKSSAAMPHIAMNVTANLLGMGNAATPSGIRAMQELDRENNSDYPDHRMCIFAVMNTASLQIVPATVAAMRSAAGAESAFDIMLPVWITSAASLCAAVGAALVFCRKRR